MAKRNIKWSQNKYERYIREGRGQGEGENYKPWLITQDFPSMGTATRVFSNKTNRMHHFFSNTQLMYFYILDWEKIVIDIREHYPLFDLNEVIKNTEDLRLDKFIDKKNNVPYIITTTFLVTCLVDGKTNYVARSIKYASELDKKITQEKLEIERRYWMSKGVDWGIVTNKDINMTKVKNIEFLHSYLNLEKDSSKGTGNRIELAEGLYLRLQQEKGSVKDNLTRFDSDYNLEAGTALGLFKSLLANRKVRVDMNTRISINMKSETIEFTGFDNEGVINELYS